MFWIGMVLIVVSGLLSINLTKNKLILLFPKLNNLRIDNILLITFFIGVIINISQHFIDKRDNNLLVLEIENQKYSQIAEYDIYGNRSGNVMGVPFRTSPIQDWGKEFVLKIDDSTFDCKCDTNAINKYFEINKILIEYPFTYFFIAKCYKNSNNKEWVIFAKRAKKILLKTTKIPGHRTHHDVVLDQVNELLKEN